MKITIGVYAHVDAGKTTFSETLLYQQKTITAVGRVDKQNTLLDYHAIEKNKGITVFSDTSHFTYQDQAYQLLDTPGHTDLSAEMEQTLPVIDVAILVINGNDGVQSHTLTLYRMLKKRGIPTYIFINKLDSQTSDLNAAITSIQTHLSSDTYYLTNLTDLNDPTYIEWLANYDDELIEPFLEGTVTAAQTLAATKRAIKSGAIHLMMGGSALKQLGVDTLMALIYQTYQADVVPATADFGGYVYKIMYNEKNERVTLLKVMSGELKPRDSFMLGEQIEKVNNVRKYSGAQYQRLEVATTGDIVGVTGLKTTQIGMGLGNYTPPTSVVKKPMLRATLTATTPFDNNFYATLQKITEQMPLISLEYPKDKPEVYINFIGKIQLEVFQDLLSQMSDFEVNFSEYTVLYKETITDTVIGYGHYEPLGHYAEIHLRMEPSDEPGLQFASEVHIEDVGQTSQNIIGASINARIQRGVLTGSPLTNVKFTLVLGKLDQMHSSNGDERQATWRAIRQGLEQATSQVLEPWYAFEIITPTDYMGRIMADIPKLQGEFEPPIITGEVCTIKGRGPVRDFAKYPDTLASLTKGTGNIQLEFDRYLPCYDQAEVIAEIGYEKDRDLDYPSSSILFKKGAGYEVKWQDMLTMHK